MISIQGIVNYRDLFIKINKCYFINERRGGALCDLLLDIKSGKHASEENGRKAKQENSYRIHKF